MAVIDLKYDTDLTNVFRGVRLRDSYKLFYLLVSFQFLVAMRGEWQTFRKHIYL
jgi:hypothetical protein